MALPRSGVRPTRLGPRVRPRPRLLRLRSEANIFRYRTTLEPVVISFGEHTVAGAPPRVRVIGDAPGELYGDVSTAVFDGPALIDGRRELLPYLLEQSVSATLHRFGVIHDPAGIRG